MNVWLKTALGLAALWAVALGGIHWLHTLQPTAQSVTDAIARTHLAAPGSAGRAAAIQRIAGQLNEVSFDDRRQLERSGVTRRFFLGLTRDEQLAFLDATLPADFKQLMDVFNGMDPAKRKAFVAHALEDMQRHEGEAQPHGDLDEKMGQRVTDEGLKAFYSEADAGTKLDLAPLIEQMQRNIQAGGGG